MRKRNRNAGMRNSEERLYSLIEERLALHANKPEIDQRIWDLFGEEWSVMFTDLVGFSRMVKEYGIIHFLQTIYESERLLLPVIEQHEGFLLKVEGDSMMLVFRNPNKALHCAISMQHVLVDYNTTKSDEEKVLLCVGIGHGKVLRVGDSEVYGAEVNAASKLGEDTAEANEILVTSAVKDVCEPLDGVGFTKLAKAPFNLGAAYSVAY